MEMSKLKKKKSFSIQLFIHSSVHSFIRRSFKVKTIRLKADLSGFIGIFSLYCWSRDENYAETAVEMAASSSQRKRNGRRNQVNLYLISNGDQPEKPEEEEEEE